MHTKNIHVISIAPPSNDGTTQYTLDQYQHFLDNYPCIVAGKNIAAHISLPSSCDFLPLSEALQNDFSAIKQLLVEGKKVIFLCHGDPLYFGIGATLIQTFGHDTVAIHSHGNSLSIMQRICHQAGIAWHNVLHVSLHGRNQAKHWHQLFIALFANKPICILTDSQSTPQRIAYEAMQRGAKGSFYIFERFSFDDARFEQIHIYELAKNASRETMHPCTLLFLPDTEATRPHLGLLDAQIKHEKNLITKSSVRATALSLLQLHKNSCLWDVGSGSGALSVEASALVYEGHIVAIESNIERVRLIEENRLKYCASIIDICHAHAPYGLDDLPRPQRIFMGGGLHKADAKAFLETFCHALEPGGRIVLSCVLLGSLHKVQVFFKQKNWNMEIVQVATSATQPLDTDVRLVPINPVFLVAVQKPH